MDARSRRTRDAPPSTRQNRSRPLPYSLHVVVAHRTFSGSRFWVIPGLAAIDDAPGGMVRENESGLEPPEPDAKDDEPSRSQPGWPHLSELDLGVCVEPSVLRNPPREGEEE
jgi:hypothetical protein